MFNLLSTFGVDLRATTNLSGSSTVMPFMASQESNTRTNTSAMPIDSRRELNSFTRTQLVKKSRWLYNNMGLIKRFVNGTARFSIGPGIIPIPDTGNVDFDGVLQGYFCDWADSKALCDVRNKMSYWRTQKHVLRSVFKDGEGWCLKAPAPDAQTVAGLPIIGRPRLQWISCESIGNLGYVADLDEQGFREGVLSDGPGAAVKYRLLEDMNPRQFDLSKSRIIDAADALHVYDVERANQIRGLPWLYHGENSALDILDLTALEKHAAKLHAAMAAAIKKRSGDAGKGGFTGDLVKEKIAKADGKTRTIAFENFLSGAGILQLALDEEFQLFTSSRPSLTFTGFIDYLIRDIAWGFGVSPEFIWSAAGLGGPAYRGVLEDAKWFFEDIQDLMVELFCHPIYMWVIARGIERGEIVVPSDVENPFICHHQGPAKITIDQGHEGDLELERLKHGCYTWEEFWGARGKSGKEQVHKRIDEIAEAMAYAKKKEVPFDYVMSLDKGGSGDPATAGDVKKAVKKVAPPVAA